jgi:hypothetical protein
MNLINNFINKTYIKNKFNLSGLILYNYKNNNNNFKDNKKNKKKNNKNKNKIFYKIYNIFNVKYKLKNYLIINYKK